MPSDPLPPRPSLRDIARELKLSHVAVSLALRDSTRISPKRRAEVKALAEKLGYRPDPMLQSLSAYRRAKRATRVDSCIAWLNQWENPAELRSHGEFDAYWRGAAAAAGKLGYRLEEFCWPRGNSGARLQTILQTRGVRGILLPPHGQGFSLPNFDWDHFSVVRFGSSVVTPRAHSVTSDQSLCARLAYQKAREKGFVRVGYVSLRQFERNTLGHFREGYLNAQEESPAPRNHIPPLTLDENASDKHASLLRAWLKKHRPDAVITTMSNLPALMDELGLRIPRDIAMATLSILDGKLDSGVDQNSFEIGRVAVSALSGLIMEGERGVPTYARRILVEGRWVDGSSLPSPRARRTGRDHRPARAGESASVCAV